VKQHAAGRTVRIYHQACIQPSSIHLSMQTQSNTPVRPAMDKCSQQSRAVNYVQFARSQLGHRNAHTTPVGFWSSTASASSPKLDGPPASPSSSEEWVFRASNAAGEVHKGRVGAWRESELERH
jgi:hypothetical protein